MTIKQTDDWHDWLIVEHGDAPLVLSIPHAGTRLHRRDRVTAGLALARAQGRRLVCGSPVLVRG